jgi:hypothetical protein
VRSLTIPEKVSGPSDGDTGRSPQLVSRSASVGTGAPCLIGIGAQPVSEPTPSADATAQGPTCHVLCTSWRDVRFTPKSGHWSGRS